MSSDKSRLFKDIDPDEVPEGLRQLLTEKSLSRRFKRSFKPEHYAPEYSDIARLERYDPEILPEGGYGPLLTEKSFHYEYPPRSRVHFAWDAMGSFYPVRFSSIPPERNSLDVSFRDEEMGITEVEEVENIRNDLKVDVKMKEYEKCRRLLENRNAELTETGEMESLQRALGKQNETLDCVLELIKTREKDSK